MDSPVGQIEGIFRVPATGGTAELVIPAREGERLTFRPLIDHVTDASGIALSPHGAWIAYQSDSSGAALRLMFRRG